MHFLADRHNNGGARDPQYSDPKRGKPLLAVEPTDVFVHAVELFNSPPLLPCI
jgi:hypothetical protein